MPVSIVFENIAGGVTIPELEEWFDVSEEQVVTVLEFVAKSLDAPAYRATAEILARQREATA